MHLGDQENCIRNLPTYNILGTTYIDILQLKKSDLYLMWLYFPYGVYIPTCTSYRFKSCYIFRCGGRMSEWDDLMSVVVV